MRCFQMLQHVQGLLANFNGLVTTGVTLAPKMQHSYLKQEKEGLKQKKKKVDLGRLSQAMEMYGNEVSVSVSSLDSEA